MRSPPRTVAELGGPEAPPLLRSAHELSRTQPVPLPPGGPALASRPVAAQPERPRTLGPNGAAHRPLDATRPHLSPPILSASWCHHLRQEPDAEGRSSGFVEGVVGNHDSYSDSLPSARKESVSSPARPAPIHRQKAHRRSIEPTFVSVPASRRRASSNTARPAVISLE